MLPRSGITKANFDRIEDAMTAAQVEEIFGEKGQTERWDGAGWFSWTAPDGSGALVIFFEDRVSQKWWNDSQETFLKRIRRWLHLS